MGEREETTGGEARAGARSRKWLKVVLVLIAAGVAFWLLQRFASAYVREFANWVHDLGPWGPIVFMVGYALATMAMAPGFVLTLAAGAIFGLWLGVLYVFFAACVGAALAFLIARYVARGVVERRLQREKSFSAIDRAVGNQGLKITVLLRLSPAFPFNLLNYALGLTKVRFLDYNIASLAMLPGSFLYVYYGKVVGLAVLSGAEVKTDVWTWVSWGVGLAATIVVTTIVTRIARNALREATESAKEGSPTEAEQVPGLQEN